ncbi:MAG: hypothetical protein ACI837_003474 [Crocinitomicaceae bacterium]|jgi:hypothetical protein
MKKVLMFAVMSLIMSAAFASNGITDPVKPVISEAVSNAGIGNALAAIKSSCPNAEGNLSYNETAIQICFVDGFITEVSFWRVPVCPGNQICIQTVVPVGTVTLGCNGEVISVDCAVSSI